MREVKDGLDSDDITEGLMIRQRCSPSACGRGGGEWVLQISTDMESEVKQAAWLIQAVCVLDHLPVP